MRWGLLVLLISACGRFGFDARQGPADTSPVTDVSRDGAVMVDGPRDGAIDVPPDSTLPLAFVQKSSVAQSAGGSTTATLPAASVAGNLLVATIATNDPTSLALPAGWMMAVQMFTAGNCASTIMYYPNNPGGITSVLLSINAGVPIDGVISEYQAGGVDVTGMASSANPQTTQTVATATSTTGAAELAVTTFCEDINTPTYTSATGWTNLGKFSNNSSSPSFVADFQLGVPMGTVTETVTSSGGGKYQAAIATFR